VGVKSITYIGKPIQKDKPEDRAEN